MILGYRHHLVAIVTRSSVIHVFFSQVKQKEEFQAAFTHTPHVWSIKGGFALQWSHDTTHKSAQEKGRCRVS